MSLIRYVMVFLLALESVPVFAAAGDLDTSFDGDGIVITDFAANSYTYSTSAIQQTDGKLVAAGMAGDQFAIARYLPDGSLDTSFDSDGLVTTSFPLPDAYAEAYSLIQQADSRLVVAGTAGGDIALARYLPDGSLDGSFGSGGLVTTDFANLTGIAVTVIQQQDGKLVAAGTGRFYGDEGYMGDFTLVRYLANGELDTGFGVGGIVTTDFKPTLDVVAELIQQSDGKLLAVGYAGGFQSLNGNEDIAIARYLPDGTLDPDFGDAGKLLLGVFTDDLITGQDRALSVIQLNDGRLVVAGFGEVNGTPMVMVALMPDGSLDSSFGINGVASGPEGFRAVALVQQADGKLVVSGGQPNGLGTADFAWVRYELDGSVDTSFGNGGETVLPTGSENNYGEAMTLIQQYDGKLVSALYLYGPGTTTLFALARLDSGQLMKAVKNDYNNDNIAGWIWQGVGNGVETQTQIWQLTLPLQSPNYTAPLRTYPPTFSDQANWDIVTSGDFNNDGDADIVWRHKTTDAWKVWQMQDGLRVAQTNWTDIFDPLHEWQAIGAGDTDKDGDDDIILSNSTTGEVMIWEMQNHAVAAAHAVGTKAGYTLNRIGDFNKDGDVDLLFRQNGGDALITWELQANAFVTERALATTGSGYLPVCAGDFDKDGDDDIMLVNSAASKQEKWFVMENYTRTQKVGGVNDGFVFLGCGDYDGDGDADSLWQRSSDEKNRVVLQQNWGATKQTVYTNAFGAANGFVYRANKN